MVKDTNDAQQERLAELLSAVQTELDLKKQVAFELEGQAALQASVIECLNGELG